jgi:BMFP domain-containing protein YqiC
LDSTLNQILVELYRASAAAEKLRAENAQLTERIKQLEAAASENKPA